MSEIQRQIVEIQKAFCLRHNAEYVPSDPESKLGFALSTKGKMPFNGLRHPMVGETCGWYLWFGEDFSNESNFFIPIHARHVYEDHPEVTKLLGLPPGYRFLMAGDHLDVWHDASLLNV